MSIEQCGRLAGKCALVTGAASGLGLAIATKFHQQGAQVMLSDLNGDAVGEVATRFGKDAASITLDVTSEADWQAAIAAVKAQFGGLHILVNNAGICLLGTIEALDLADWRKTHEVNLDSVFFGTRAVLPLIVETTQNDGGRGSILNVSSISAIIAAANMAGYNSSKAAVRHLTKSIALHCARQQYAVTCNSVHPTFINTPLLDDLVGKNSDRLALIEKLSKQVPLGRIGEPDDVAWAAVYLCSDEAKFVTGTELYIDGGISAT